jgi:ABC-type Fe3+-siderophore transport system permease subunit
MKKLLRGIQCCLFLGHSVQQFYLYGLSRVAKGQMNPFLIYLCGVQLQAIYAFETPPVDFAADEDNKGYNTIFSSVSFFVWWSGMELRADGTVRMMSVA